MQNIFPNNVIEMTGHFVYPKNGYMGWHTNANYPCLRCYITYSENGDSYFKYRDPTTKKIIIDNDNVGWKLRKNLEKKLEFFDVYPFQKVIFTNCGKFKNVRTKFKKRLFEKTFKFKNVSNSRRTLD